MIPNDTIAAIATPAGEGGVAIIRISGPGAREILSRAFSPAPKRDRMLTYGHVMDAGKPIDEAMAVFLPAPHTYTREDVAEIHCHGGRYITRRVLALVLALGARAANPGEFTLRAFLHGRVTLDEAEAVMALVNAGGEAAGRAAMRQLNGGVSAYVHGLRDRLVDQIARIEAHLDFPEEVDEEFTRTELIAALSALEGELRAQADERRARVVRDGASCVLLGAPNVGKSSIMNALAGSERAIVTDIAGTTRDVLTERISLGGLMIELSDTAGVRETGDEIEKIGVERARAAAAAADAVLAVFDAGTPWTPQDKELLSALDARAICVLNKTDLPVRKSLPGSIEVSCLTGEGLDELQRAILKALDAPQAGENALVCERHIALAREALAEIRAALDAARARVPLDALSVHLHAALNRLGEITGEDATEDVITRVFQNFCVGK